MALSDDKLWDLWNAQGTDDMSKAEAFVFARAIEAEVRKEDEALIRQLMLALDDCAEDSEAAVHDYVQAYGESHRPHRLKGLRDIVAKAKEALTAPASWTPTFPSSPSAARKHGLGWMLRS